MSQKEIHKRYEENAQRVQLISVRSVPSDNLIEWDKIKKWLESKGEGAIKAGIYALARENNVI